MPEKALLHSYLYEARFFGEKSWEQQWSDSRRARVKGADEW